MRRYPTCRRSGFTLIETMVVLVLGGLVLGLVMQVGVTLQRQFERAGARIGEAVQLREAAAILPLDLRSLSAPAGDIAAGEARDSSLEIRATIASAIVCAIDGEKVLLAFPGYESRDAPSRLPQLGDTLWLLDDAALQERWRPHLVHSIDGTGTCAADGDGDGVVRWEGFLLAHALRVGIGAGSGALVGSAVRVTRPERISFYRAADNAWYLGLRDWNGATARFNPVQPVSGPYHTPRGAAQSDAGLSFRYFDSLGAVIPSGATDTRRITRIEVSLRAAASGKVSAPTDSLTIAVALRNRR